jgi:hypothetical protein
MSPEEKRHYMRLCDHTCLICLEEAQAEARSREHGAIFEDTGRFILVFGRERPVLRVRDTGRYLVGEALSASALDGGGGRVWSARTLPKLKATVFVAERLLGELE